MARQPAVNKDKCICCQLCADVLPGVFRMDRLGLAEVHNGAGAGEAQIQKIIDACPANCIYWSDS